MGGLTELYRTIILALVQGITEFLPVSSSAHLVLLPELMDWQDQGLLPDVVVHLGTLCAVLFYYRAELFRKDGWMRGDTAWHDRLLPKLAVASVPVLFSGYFFEPWIVAHARTPVLIATMTIVFAFVLLAANYRMATRTDVTMTDAVFVGVAQAVALLPGVSRMGVVLSATLLLGIARTEALRFTFLLAIPVIFFAAVYKLAQSPGATDLSPSWWSLALGFFVSAVTAFLTIRLFVNVVERIGLMPFIIYRLLLGVTVLLFV